MITHIFFERCGEVAVEFIVDYAGNLERKDKAYWQPNIQQWAIYSPGEDQPYCFCTNAKFKENFIMAMKNKTDVLDSIVAFCNGNKVHNEPIAISPLVKQLRDILSQLGVLWYDASEKIGHTTYERTKFDDVSVVYFYNSECGSAISSYGYPDKLECWCEQWDPEPKPMTVGEIVHKYITSYREDACNRENLLNDESVWEERDGERK